MSYLIGSREKESDEMKTGRCMTLLFLMTFVVASSGKDFYQILGVKRDATDIEIKRRFRELGST